MSELINRLNQNPLLAVCGWKEIELEFLQQALIPGTALIIGERNGKEGVSAVVLENDEIVKPITCIDIEDCVPNSFVYQKIADSSINFFFQDLIKYPRTIKFDNIVCLNVLEHFGTKNNEIDKQDYDKLGLQKMFDLCGGQIILSIPYTLFPGYDLHVDGGRNYTQTRINLIKEECGKKGFEIEFEQTIIEVNKSGHYRQINDEQLKTIEDYTKHDFLKLFLIKSVWNVEADGTQWKTTAD